MDNQRNLLLAVVLCGILIIGYDAIINYFYPQADQVELAEGVEPAAGASAGSVEGTAQVAADLDGQSAPEQPVDLSAALADPERVVIDAPRVAGSINLQTARIDDLVLKDHRQTVERDSGPVRLLAPERTEDQYYIELGFLAGGERLPAGNGWQADGERLTAETPITLTRTVNGITYAIRYAIDENYMITAEQSIANRSNAAAVVQPFALINRTSRNASPDEFIVHSGPIGVFDDTVHDPNSYEELAELGRDSPEGGVDWLGFTDRYWLAALIPATGEGSIETDTVGFRSLGNDLFRSEVIYRATTLPAGRSLSQTTQVFAGAKESTILDDYEEGGITLFGKAISWGWFEIIEKPLLWLLRTLNGLIGNFGLAIIALTFIIRGFMFPIAQRGFASMASMKAIQPDMKKIQEKYKEDRAQQQQEMQKLFKERGVNPVAGCLPMLLQIPVFFALYKVLILAIEMRHEPFTLWIRDLSAPDPAHILNLFGLLPFEVPGLLAIGPLAILLGFTMWLTFKLNPSTLDPMQQQIFSIMPWVLMFVMAPFAAGLLLYWNTSNVLTLAQQKYLYSKHPELKAQAEKERKEKEREKAKAET